MNKVVVDYRIDKEEKENLEALGYEVIICPPSKVLYDAVCGHPDMLMHIVDSSTIMVHKDMDKDFVSALSAYGYNILFSAHPIESTYPGDIALNAVNLSNIFMHNLDYTDTILLKAVKTKKLLKVKQGYTKCSTAIVSKDAIITSDTGICKTLEKEGFDVLLLPPGDIQLPGLNYGFIGGCCGLLRENLLAFYGDLNQYAYGKEVLSFLYKHNVDAVALRKGKVIDRGSIFLLP